MSRVREIADPQVPLAKSAAVLRDMAREFLALRVSPAYVRERIGAHDVDGNLWQSFAELEWLGLLLPEELGGSAGTLLEGALISEELGGALAPTFFYPSTILGATALLAAPDDVRGTYLPRVADGSLRVTFAWPAGPGWSVASRRGEHAVTGELPCVLEAATADLVMTVAARPGGDPCLVGIESRHLAIEPLESIDLTRSYAGAVADNAPAEFAAELDDADALLARIASVGRTMAAAEFVGGAARCLALTVEWSKDRVQFGKPIGSFQAIKHRCVAVLGLVEGARAAVRLAARLGDAYDPGFDEAAVIAVSLARNAYRDAAAATMQIHGGMGFTWDHDAHLHLRRAKGAARLLRCTCGDA